MSVEPFNRLVKLAARAFYDDRTTKGDNQPKPGRSDNRGITVIVLDALTRRQWVKEEDLAKDLKLHSKLLRRTLQFLKDEKLVTRDHRRETGKGEMIYNAAIAATSDGQQGRKEADDKMKPRTHSYCCLDYAQVYDVVRYRLHRMKTKLKDELENKNTVMKYMCPNCEKRYNALDALRLVSMDDMDFHCESCDGKLVEDMEKLASQEVGDGDDNARKRQGENLKDMLQKMEAQLRPLMEQIGRIKDLPAPEFGTLQAWEARNAARGVANGDSGANDFSKSSQGGYGGTPMPFVGETRVDVAFSGVDIKEEDTKAGGASLKVLPPWMIKQGMNLTKEQRGEIKEELKMEGSSASGDFKDDKKSAVGTDDKTNLQDEYVKAYYAAILKRQQEQEEAVKMEEESSNTNIDNNTRQVGMKSKREEDEDDVEWEEAAPNGGNTSESYKVNDLNVEAADASGDDEDDIDWEEG